MRRLQLLRHAKAERLQPGHRDRDRALTAQGRDDAQLIGSYMAAARARPDHILVSPAVRTRETWNLVAGNWASGATTTYDERIYDAEPESLLDIIAETPPEVGTLLMVGHNPGLHAAAALLVAAGDTALRQRLDDGFPTSALATIAFDFDDWSDLHLQSGRLESFVSPRSLAA